MLCLCEYDLRQKKELSIKHIIQHGMTEGSISIGEINCLLYKETTDESGRRVARGYYVSQTYDGLPGVFSVRYGLKKKKLGFDGGGHSYRA